MNDDFTNKVNHNLQGTHKLRLDIDLKNGKYKPNKIKIKIKVSRGIKQRNRLLKLSITTVFKYPSEIIRHIHKYIYEHQLQNRYDWNVFTPDESLSSLLTPLKDTELEYTSDHLPLSY